MKAISLLSLLPALVVGQVSVTLYEDANYQGFNTQINVNYGFCSGVSQSVNDRTSSIQVGGDAPTRCYFYDSAYCPDVVTEGALIIYSGGCPNLGAFNDKISSFVCLQYNDGETPNQGGNNYCNAPPGKRSVPRRGLGDA